MLAIVDYGAGNLTSVARALNHLNIPSLITANPEKIRQAQGVIFPGVGQASQAMQRLSESGLDKELAKVVERRQPLLGICLGCHILLENSTEGPTKMLGLVKGDCPRFADNLLEEDGSRATVPHMGWNSLIRVKDSPLLAGIPENAEFYFVHSYYARPQEDLTLATTRYGHSFCSFYGRDGLWAVQFHPEKSGPAGLRLLQNFSNWCKEHGHAL